MLLFAVLPLLAPRSATQTGQQATVTETEEKNQQDTKKRSKSMKTHFLSGNQAMQDAKGIRQQLQTAADSQKPTLLPS